MANINRGRYAVQLLRAPVPLGDCAHLGTVTRGATVRDLVRDSAGDYFSMPGREPLIHRKVVAAIEAFNLAYPTPDSESQRQAPNRPPRDPFTHHAETLKNDLS
jgi:hypothetical protein